MYGNIWELGPASSKDHCYWDLEPKTGTTGSLKQRQEGTIKHTDQSLESRKNGGRNGEKENGMGRNIWACSFAEIKTKHQ